MSLILSKSELIDVVLREFGGTKGAKALAQ